MFATKLKILKQNICLNCLSLKSNFYSSENQTEPQNDEKLQNRKLNV